MKPVVLMPYRPSGAERERNYNHTRAWWEKAAGLPLTTADSGDDPFAGSASRNLAAANAGDWDVAIFTDADFLLNEPRQAHEALKLALKTGAFVVAHDELRWLGADATERVCAGVNPAAQEPLYKYGRTWVGICAVSRELFEAAGRYDEGFLGTGMEDIAFYKAAATLGGTGRVKGVMYHLDHPRPAEDARPSENWSREVRYSQAFGDVLRMLAVIAER